MCSTIECESSPAALTNPHLYHIHFGPVELLLDSWFSSVSTVSVTIGLFEVFLTVERVILAILVEFVFIEFSLELSLEFVVGWWREASSSKDSDEELVEKDVGVFESLEWQVFELQLDESQRNEIVEELDSELDPYLEDELVIWSLFEEQFDEQLLLEQKWDQVDEVIDEITELLEVQDPGDEGARFWVLGLGSPNPLLVLKLPLLEPFKLKLALLLFDWVWGLLFDGEMDLVKSMNNFLLWWWWLLWFDMFFRSLAFKSMISLIEPETLFGLIEKKKKNISCIFELLFFLELGKKRA